MIQSKCIELRKYMQTVPANSTLKVFSDHLVVNIPFGFIPFSCHEFIFNLPNINLQWQIYAEKCEFLTNRREVYLEFQPQSHETE